MKMTKEIEEFLNLAITEHMGKGTKSEQWRRRESKQSLES